MDKTQLITAFTAIVSLALGALLQHLLGARAEVRKQRELLRASAYADFLRGVSLLASMHRTDFPQQRLFEATALVGDARSRIALYGSEAMVRAMAEISEYPMLTTRPACRTFVRACRQMRIDTHASVALTDEELSRVVFGHSLQDVPELLEGSARSTAEDPPKKHESPAPRGSRARTRPT